MRLSADGASADRLQVTGDANLGTNEGTLLIGSLAQTSPSGGQVYSLITSTGSLSGSFGSVLGAPGVDVSGFTSQVGIISGTNTYQLVAPGSACLGVCWDGGGTSSLWTDRFNWTGDTVPGARSSVYITSPGGSSVTLDSGSFSLANLYSTSNNGLILGGGNLSVSGTTQLVGSLSVLQGSTLSLSGAATLTAPAGVVTESSAIKPSPEAGDPVRNTFAFGA
jgi:hypothetical protein